MPFDDYLAVARQEVDFAFKGEIAWLDFWLNPRRLRGSDFLMRWSQGVWSEHRLINAVNETKEFFALEYGPSSTAPENDIRAFELYFDLLESAGLGDVKRPDLLLFKESNRKTVAGILREVEGHGSLSGLGELKDKDFFKTLSPSQRLAFIPENDALIQALVSRAILAVECENSLWIAEKMPGYYEKLRPMKRLGNKPGLKKNAVAPTIILKEEDRTPLRSWQANQKIPIHIWHAFFDRAYAISFSKAEELIQEGLIEGSIQIFQAPGGATTQKTIYKIYHHYAYPLGESVEEPELAAKYLLDKNGHILPFVHFEKGRMKLSREALATLRECSDARET